MRTTGQRTVSILYIGNLLTRHGLNPTGADTLTERLRQDFTVFTASSVRNQIGRMLDMLRSILLYRGRVSVVLIDTYSTKSFNYAFACGMLCRLLRIPYIPVLRGGNLPARLQRSPRMSRMLFKAAAINVSPSSYLKEVFEREGYKVACIPNSIDIGDYPYRNRSAVSPKLLYVRAYQKIYNPVLAVQVLDEVSARHREARLCMVGPDKDGSLELVRREISRLGLANRVMLHGKLSKKEWIALSDEYDFFINTTNYDNMPVSVMEAMALGMVVISTNVGGVPALIDHLKNGILVEPNDAQGFVDWICRVIEEPELARHLSAAAREKALSFDWSAVRPQWSRVITNAMAKEVNA
nr:MAG: glycosyl transferase family 1 [Bacteroidota bacterium]